MKRAGFSVGEFESMELWLVAAIAGEDRPTSASDWEMTDADRARMARFAGSSDLTSQVMAQMGIRTS